MAVYGDDLESDVNRFSEDLNLFEVPSPQSYWREVTAKRSDTSASDDFRHKQNVYMASMQQQRSQVQTMRYSPKNMYGGTVQTSEHRSAFAASAVSVREAKPPIPAGAVMGAGAPGVGVGNNASSLPGKPLPVSPYSQVENRGVMISGTRYPAPRTGNMMQTHTVHQTQQTIYANLPGSSINTNSNYSSPRSSLGSGGDSKNSSPRTSLTNPPPPPPYDQRFGSPRSSIASPRSSIASLDSKHSSPRASLTGVYLEKFPSPRGSIAGPQDRVAIHRAIAGLEQDLYSSMSSMPPSLTSLGPRSVNLLSDNRFNEPAPPHIYTDPRMRTLPAQPQVSVHSGHVNASVTHNGVHTVPHTQSCPVGMGLPVNSGAAPQSPAPPVIPARVPLHPAGQSDAEKKLAALTQQLERDMRLTSPGPTPKTSPETPPEPPPPYHGPHELELMGSSSQPQPVRGGQGKAPVRLVAPVQGVPVQNPPSQSQPQSPGGKGLSWQVTPPRGVGPSEAEKKLAALTQQLEDELEQVPQGEYFGEYLCTH
ncbi:hypothetical protein BaRGS_00009792, partial [Batillaria attramentaria]